MEANYLGEFFSKADPIMLSNDGGVPEEGGDVEPKMDIKDMQIATMNAVKGRTIHGAGDVVSHLLYSGDGDGLRCGLHCCLSDL